MNRTKLFIQLVIISVASFGASCSSKQNDKMDNIPESDKKENYTREEIIYGRTYGTALTMDVFKPKQKQNGAAIIFVISEGFYSEHEKIEYNIPTYIEPFIKNGYAVFAVIHGSNPKFSLIENIEHVSRSVRFIRHNAEMFGIDANKVGITGDSGGGYFALMMNCKTENIDEQSVDPVDRQSSKVQAAVAFYPPTDFLNWGEPGNIMMGEHPKVALFGAFDFHRLDTTTNSFQAITDVNERQTIGRDLSPINHVGSFCAPTLIVYGDQDSFIPPQQSIIMAQKLKDAGVECKLILRPGGEHDEETVRAHIPDAIEWFNKYLF